MKYVLIFIGLLLLVGVVFADTLVVYPITDGYLQNTTDASWQTERDAPGSGHILGSVSSTVYTRLLATTTSNVYSELNRAYFIIPTGTPLAANGTCTVSSASVFVNKHSGTNALGSPSYALTGWTPAGNTVVVADYNRFSDTLFSNQIAYGSLAAGYNEFTLTASGISAIPTTTGNNFTFMLRDSWDYTNTNGATWSSGASSQTRWYSTYYTSNKPYGRFEYTCGGGADTTPPNSVTNIVNQSLSCNTMDFSWTNPTDADFGNLLVWRNNTALSNLTNTTTYVNWTGLPEATPMTISLKTCDLSGNCNATFMNKTSTGDPCPVTPTPTPTPTPTATPPAGCIYTNITTVIDENNTEWSIHEGNYTWGTAIINRTQGNISWYSCYATPTATTARPRTPEINPSVRDISFWCKIPILNWILNNCEVKK